MTAMRQNAIACASVQLLFNLPAAFLLWFAAAGGENASPEELAEHDWLAYAAPALLAFSAGTIVAVAKRRPLWATAGVAAQVAIGVPVLRLALEDSVHSDGKLMVFAAVVWGFGLLALAESFRDHRRD